MQNEKLNASSKKTEYFLNIILYKLTKLVK